MYEISSLKLSQILVTRLCHDIVGPIGAINNGVEFLQESDGMEQQAIGLIADSAIEAISRIQFYRYLYGIIKDKESVGLDDKKTLIDNFYQTSKVKLHWHEIFHKKIMNISPQSLRIICNLIYIAGSSLIRGGEINVSFADDDVILIHATGVNVMLNDNLQHILRENDFTDADSSNIQVIYTKMLIDSESGKLSFNIDASNLTLNYKLKK